MKNYNVYYDDVLIGTVDSDNPGSAILEILNHIHTSETIYIDSPEET